MKFDAYIGRNQQFRVLQWASAEQLAAYCAAHGYVVSTNRRIGVVLHEVELVKP